MRNEKKKNVCVFAAVSNNPVLNYCTSFFPVIAVPMATRSRRPVQMLWYRALFYQNPGNNHGKGRSGPLEILEGET